MSKVLLSNSKVPIEARSLKYDLIRAAAIIGVVATHAEAITASPTNYLGGISWWFANLVHSFASSSVPLFVLLTGALVLKKTVVTYRYVWSKIINQFILPLIFWLLLYFWWNARRSGAEFSVNDLFSQFFYTDIGHLYYLQVVIGLYLSLPIIHKLVRSTTDRGKFFLAAVSVVLVAGTKLISFININWDDKTNAVLIFLPYISYLFLGSWLGSLAIKKFNLFILSFVAALVIIILSIASYNNVVAFNNSNFLFWTEKGGSYVWDTFNIFVMMLACLVFLILLNIETVATKLFQVGWIKTCILVVSSLSFGIYLIHPLIMDLIDTSLGISIQFISYPLWIWYILRTSIVLVISSVTVYVIKKTPIVRVIFGVSDNAEIRDLK